MQRPKSIYVYKLTTDNGGAPCVFNGMLSLALCKPQIRKMAVKGDLIIGFGGKRLGQRPIYAAYVTEKPAPGAYYRLRRFARRPDCIYRSKKGRAVLKRSARFHSSGDNLKKDVGDTFENGYVLLSRKFRYLGKAGTEKQLSKFPRVKRLLAGLYLASIMSSRTNFAITCIGTMGRLFIDYFNRLCPTGNSARIV